MEVLVEDETSKVVLQMRAEPSVTTIMDIKTKIQEQEGIHPDQQSLSFAGNELENDLTIKGVGQI